MALETKELSNSIIKEVAADVMMYRGECLNADTAMQTGFYRCPANCQGLPSAFWHHLKVFAAGDMVRQEAQRLATGKLYIRITNASSFAGIGWKELAFVETT